jgi:azurin
MRLGALSAWRYLGLQVAAGLVTTMVAAEPIVIKAVDGLQFDIKQFAVKPGEKVSLTFENADSSDMAHNLVITAPGAKDTVAAAANDLGSEAEKQGYVPKVPEVLFAVRALHPPEKRTITFTAPTTVGVYPYVCTLPGHAAVMFGAMYVGTPMPAEATPAVTDGDTPVHDHAAMAHQMGAATPHAYPLNRPFMYRMFMPDAGPAAIAVALPGKLNYCWDAGACRFRYVWSGDCVDNTPYWKGNGNGLAKLLGPISYRAPSGSALRIEPERDPVVRFHGYHLAQGLPEFAYTLDGIAVRERITATAAGDGLLFTFTVDTDQPLTYRVDPAQGATFTSSAGAFTDGVLRLPPKAGRSFTITVIPPATRPAAGAKP